MYDNQVVIIGAGICGLATALALHKKGIRSVVMERSDTLRSDGAAITIRPNGWRALDQLDVADILRHTTIPLQRERVILLDGERQQELSLHHCIGEIRCLRRKDIIDTLYAALPPATVMFGCQLESIKLDPHTTKPILRFIDGSSIIAKVVIGCDGGKSIVADFLNLKPTKVFPLCEIRGLTNYPNGHSLAHEFTSFKKDNIFVGRIPIDSNLVYWFCTQPYNLKDERIWKYPEAIQHYILELLSSYPQEIQEMIKTTDTISLSFKRIRYRAPWDLLTGKFSRGTMIVAGDAMHIMGPFLGQGGSTALEDAVVLARNIAQLGLNHVEESFNLFVRQRRMRVLRVLLQTYLIGMVSCNTSHLKKFICSLLVILLFPKEKNHMDYDCGTL